MRYIINHDLHIHSKLSQCPADVRQSTEVILAYAERNGYTDICLTDHLWDGSVPKDNNRYDLQGIPHSNWYNIQDFEHICKALPLPQSDKVKFHFGCETEMDKYGTIGISDKAMDKLDFIIVPVNHFHMLGFTLDEKDDSVKRRAEVMIRRIRHLLSLDLPFYKMGIAHITSTCIAGPTKTHPFAYIEALQSIEDNVFRDVFNEVAQKGIGVELNVWSFDFYEKEWKEILRPYQIAKQCGCKFYLGGDAHSPVDLGVTRARFEMIVNALELEETDKFSFGTMRKC